MEFYFIRHAQSSNNSLWDLTGSNRGRSVDAELSEAGLRQAELLAGHLCRGSAAPAGVGDPQNRAGYGLTHVYTSLMVRAVTTGQIVSRALGLPLVAWPDWHEGGGVYEEDEETGERLGRPGYDRAYFAERFPDLVWPSDLGPGGWWNRPFESPEERVVRGQRVLQELLVRHGGTDARVAVFSHGSFYNYFMAALLGMSPLRRGQWLLMNNAAITRVDFVAEQTVLVYSNRTGHLPDDLIT